MSVLSRPVRHKASAPTQREVRIPLPRTEPEGPALRPSPQTTQPAPTPDRRARTTKLVGGGLAVALAVGVGTYLLVDNDGGSTVAAPSAANVVSASDLARDRALAARGPAAAGAPADSTGVTEAEVAAAQAQRLRNSGDATTGLSGSSTTGSDAARLSEAQRDAALARRAQNFTAGDVPAPVTGAGTPLTGAGTTSGLLGTTNPLGPPAS